MTNVELFFTPIVFQTAHKTPKQWAIEACDDYFSYFGGKKIRILDDKTTQIYEEKPSFQNLILTVLKIISCCTLILPTLFFLGKLFLRPDISIISTPPPSPIITKPAESLFAKLFCAPYDAERLRKFGLSDEDIEKTRSINPDKKITIPNVIFEDLEKLLWHNWLNDSCVNEHLRLQILDKPSFCFVNSLSVAHQKLRRINNPYPVFQTADGKKLEKLYDTDKTIFFPLNVHNNHWALLVCNLGTKKLHYYDSLSGPPPEVINEVRDYLLRIAHLEGVALPPDAFECTTENCPQQKNGSDCGVFVLLAAKHIIENAPLTYSQDDAPYMRLKILSDFIR